MAAPRTSEPTPEATAAAIDAVWRIESARLIAGLARLTRDVGLAEDLAQDALVAALEQWPRTGVPDNPGAWLMTIAKRRAVDLFRRNERLDRKHAVLARELQATGEASDDPALTAALEPEPIEDDLLRLIFTCCHPVLSTDARVALTLRMLGGLSTGEIARAFLITPQTAAQRIVRAKQTLAREHVAFEVPEPEQRAERLGSVLEVIYLIFNEGYSPTAGADWLRPQLADEALRLGRILAGLAPDEPEVLGLLALMELQASRAHARTDAAGEPILLLDQNRALWDQMLIGRGLAALQRAQQLATAPDGTAVAGTYVLQAALAACHAQARRPEQTDWRRIVGLYSTLLRSNPSPVIELNRAVAVSMADGPQAALVLVDAIAERGELAGYHLLPSVRGDLLARMGRPDEARAEFERAAALTHNERERALLLGRAADCG